MDLGVHNRQRPPAFESSQGQAVYFERLQKELDLTPAQSEQVKSISGTSANTTARFSANAAVVSIRFSLPEQRVKFEQILRSKALEIAPVVTVRKDDHREQLYL